MLPDVIFIVSKAVADASQCTYRCVVLPDLEIPLSTIKFNISLNAPTGAWCSLTLERGIRLAQDNPVSMHLQVRGAP